MNKKGLSKLVNYEIEWRRKQKTDREIILALYGKFKNQNLSHDKIIQQMIKEFLDIGFDENYWKQKIERVLRSERLIDDDVASQKNDKTNFDIEKLLSKDIVINQREEWGIGKIVKVNDKIGIVSKIIPNKGDE